MWSKWIVLLLLVDHNKSKYVNLYLKWSDSAGPTSEGFLWLGNVMRLDHGNLSILMIFDGSFQRDREVAPVVNYQTGCITCCRLSIILWARP